MKDILNPSNNTTPYQEKINQTNNPIFKPLSDIFNFITQNYLNENINIVSNNTNSKSVGFDSLKAQKQNSYELNINKEAKKIYNNDFIKYLIIFVLIVVLIVIGYKRF